MTKKRKGLLNLATDFFIDSNECNNEELLIGYYQLSKRLTNNSLLISPPNSILKIYTALEALTPIYRDVIISKYFDNLNFIECGEKLNLNEEVVCKFELKSLIIMRKLIRRVDYHSILLNDLNLSTTTICCLNKVGIKNLAQLLQMTYNELFIIPKMDYKSIKEIHELKLNIRT